MDEETSFARNRLRKRIRRIPCPNFECQEQNSPYARQCQECQASLTGGVVFSAAQSGTRQAEWLEELRAVIDQEQRCHLHDVGATMEDFARQFDPSINWDRILDRPEEELRFRRAQAFTAIKPRILEEPSAYHLLACHITFRWRAFLTRGLDPHLLSPLRDHLRLFLTVIDGVNEVYCRLLDTDWGNRERLELALARDEEVFITGLIADMFRKPHYLISRDEPAPNMAELVLAPWRPRVYLSFPITGFVGTSDEQLARSEIEAVRDTLRKWAVVFDPYAIKDYDLTYQVPEMEVIAEQLGEQTEHRDYRFIDQSEVLVAFFPATPDFPQSVQSKGVEAELRHAKTSGKIIYLCHPDIRGGPFSISPNYPSTSKDHLLELLHSHFEGLDNPEDG